MKKVLLILIVVMFVLVGCTAGVSQAEYDAVVRERDDLQLELNELREQMEVNELGKQNGESVSVQPSQTVKPGEFDAKQIVSALEVKQYEYTDIIKNNWVVLVVKNTSAFNLEISANITAYNENKEMIGAKSSSEVAFGPGQTIALSTYFDDLPSHIEYDLSVVEDDLFIPVVSSLKHEMNTLKDKVVVSVTNTGEETAEFVQGTVIFFKGDKCVDSSSQYFVNSNHEIKPGETINEEVSCYQDFDRAEIYFTGRAS